MLKHPRAEMHIDSAIARLQHTLATTLLQLPLQHILRPICLRHVSLQRVLVLHLVVVSVPVRLPESRDEKDGPFVEVDFLLLCGAGAEGVGLVVVSKQVVDHGARFPGCDADVGVFEGRDSARGE
jgi:hypothetical protein